MLGALSGLTIRGRAFLAAGVAAICCALLLGQRDLLRVGLLLAVLPLASTLAVGRTRYRLGCSRTVEPARVPAGEPARVVLRLENLSYLPTGLLLVEDGVPYVLGSRPRFVLDRVELRGHRLVSYRLRCEVRGRYRLGPLSLRIADPFGMCELSRAFRQRDTLVVTPAVEVLPAVSVAGEWSGSGDSHSRSVAAAGEDDVATREYRQGDALHRVHWRSTARRGELMVRREEQPWQSRATILLDTRAVAHRGEGPGSSFEWAVSAAASVGTHLVRHGYAVRLITDTGTGISGMAQDTGANSGDIEGLILDGLAVITASTTGDLGHAGAELRRGGSDGLLVAVLGALSADEAESLARLRHGTTTAVAVLLDTASWADGGIRGEPQASYERNALVLRSGGWRVLRARVGDRMAQLWLNAGRPTAGAGGSSAGVSMSAGVGVRAADADPTAGVGGAA
jgi:uncharacterized protein (DUF58 family)